MKPGSTQDCLNIEALLFSLLFCGVALVGAVWVWGTVAVLQGCGDQRRAGSRRRTWRWQGDRILLANMSEGLSRAKPCAGHLASRKGGKVYTVCPSPMGKRMMHGQKCGEPLVRDMKEVWKVTVGSSALDWY